MRKTTKNRDRKPEPLTLKTEQVRVLTVAQLASVVGGLGCSDSCGNDTHTH